MIYITYNLGIYGIYAMFYLWINKNVDKRKFGEEVRQVNNKNMCSPHMIDGIKGDGDLSDTI